MHSLEKNDKNKYIKRGILTYYDVYCLNIMYYICLIYIL